MIDIHRIGSLTLETEFSQTPYLLSVFRARELAMFPCDDDENNNENKTNDRTKIYTKAVYWMERRGAKHFF